MSKRLDAIFRHLAQRPSLKEVGVEAYRSFVELGAVAFKPAKDIVETPFELGSVTGLWFTPENAEPGRSLVHIHGGGFLAGSSESYRDLATRLAREARCSTLVFDYRLAPEHPCPAGLSDCQAVWEHLTATLDHTPDLSGDSAGANLAVGLTARCIKENRPVPRRLALISPWLDLTGQAPDFTTKADEDPMLRPDDLRHTARLYAGDLALDDPRVSPLFQDVAGFPTTLIQAGSREILTQDARALARKLEDAGSTVRLEIWDGMFHVWHYFARYLSQGQEALEDLGNFLRGTP